MCVCVCAGVHSAAKKWRSTQRPTITFNPCTCRPARQAPPAHSRPPLSPALGAGGRLEAVSSSARWEDVVGYSRAVKRGPFIFVSGGWAAPEGRHLTVTP